MESTELMGTDSDIDNGLYEDADNEAITSLTRILRIYKIFTWLQIEDVHLDYPTISQSLFSRLYDKSQCPKRE